MRPAVTSAIPASAASMSEYAWVAPNFSASSCFHSAGSTANTFRAPEFTAPCSAAIPTPPRPTTATSSPGRTAAALVAEPQPVVTPQLTRAAASKGIALSILTTEVRCTTRYGEYVPSSEYGIDVLSSRLNAKRAVRHRCARHQSHAEVAQVALTGLARPADAAGRDERRGDVIAGLQIVDALADLDDDACAFVTAEHREAAAPEYRR